MLGQNERAARIRRQLQDPGIRAVRVTGPSGSGKSYVAGLVATGWVEDGGALVVAVGDDEHSGRDLYPLLSGLSRTPGDWLSVALPGVRTAVAAANTAVGLPGVGTTIFDLLTSGFRQRLDRLLKPYTGAEREIILDLRRSARTRGLLVVADNAHWWDADSLRLLCDLLSESLGEALPELRSVVALVVDTADQQRVAAPEALAALFRTRVGYVERVSRCTLDEFAAVLQAFGMDAKLPEEVLRSLYLATNGHLKLAEQVAAYAGDGAGIDEAARPIDERYVSALLAARFASLGSFSPDVSDLLVRAAILGLSFTERELVCITGEKRSELRELLTQAERIGFITREGQSVGFSHDVIRAAILADQNASTLAGLYGKLAECLAILRPADYASRAQALANADDADGERDMVALSSVARLRRGSPSSRVLGRLELASPDDELRSYVEKLADAYTSVGLGDFAGPLPALKTPMPRETSLMAAERNYVAALCLMELQTVARAKEAASILRSWLHGLERETDLRLRYFLLLQQAQVLSQDFDDARETENEIERQLLERQSFDPDAAVALQIQNRRAGAVNVPEIAELRIREAVAFFRRGTNDTARDALELFRALNNLAGIQLRLGKDAEAYSHGLEAEQIALESADVVKRPDVLASNVVLAGLRSGALDVYEAVERQQFIVASPEGSDDKFIHRCNLAGYLLLASRDDEAADELRALGDELHAGEFDESYLRFYWSALWVASAALAGDGDEALRRHRDMDAFVADLRWPCAAHVRRRHHLLDDVMSALPLRSDRSTVDQVLLDSHPGELGPAWAYYARLIPCCELSFWSDS